MKRKMLQILGVLLVVSLIFSPSWFGTKSPYAVQAQSNFRGSTTILVYDTSGSMGEEDITGLTKMQAAINAGQSILSVIDAEDQANLGVQNEIGIVEFSAGASVVSELTTDISAIQAALNSLYDGGGTALPGGLSLGLEMAGNATSGSVPTIILLSDGIPTTGLNGEDDEDIARQQALNLASDAGSRGICVYTVGFGVLGTTGSVSGDASIDQDFLEEIASRSGCGKYYNAQNATDLQSVFVLARHESQGDIRYQGQGQIAQDEHLVISTVSVPAGQESLLYTLQWPGSKLDPTLLDPNGITVDSSYPGATFTQGKTIATVIVQNPIAGQWQFGAIGVDVPEGVLTYNAALSTRSPLSTITGVPPMSNPNPRTSNSGGGIYPFVILVVLGSAVLIFYFKKRQGGTGAYLQVANDPNNTRVIMLKNNFVIGRNPGSSLRLADTTTSRQHAILTQNKGGWYIQDMGSSGGTFVNGRRVQSASLQNGDQIKVGQATFVFRR